MAGDTAGRILNMFKLAIVIVVIIIIAYVVYTVSTSGALKCLFSPIDCIGGAIGVPPQCPPNMQDNKAGLCYEKCPDGYKWDGMQMCYKPCPGDWKGGETIAHCQHETIYSTVGTSGTDKRCKPRADGGLVVRSPDNVMGLCYDLPDAGWEVSAPGFVALKCPPGSNNTGATCTIARGVGKIPIKNPCPPGTRDDGTSCWNDIQLWTDCFQFGPGKSCPAGWNKTALCTCQRGTGQIVQTLFQRQSCPPGQELQDGLCYPKVDARFNCAGPVCHMSRQVRSAIGTVPTECPPDKELHGLLCYPRCPNGFSRQGYNLEFCKRDLPAEYKDIGIGGYEKPAKALPIAKSVFDVGVCPTGKVRQALSCVDEPSADQSWF